MKLYTEEEIHRTFGLILNKTFYDGFIGAMKPIELPSDEEIKEESNKEYQEQEQSYENSTEFLPFNDSPYLKAGFFQGAKWLRDKIINQNK